MPPTHTGEWLRHQRIRVSDYVTNGYGWVITSPTDTGEWLRHQWLRVSDYVTNWYGWVITSPMVTGEWLRHQRLWVGDYIPWTSSVWDKGWWCRPHRCHQWLRVSDYIPWTSVWDQGWWYCPHRCHQRIRVSDYVTNGYGWVIMSPMVTGEWLRHKQLPVGDYVPWTSLRDQGCPHLPHWCHQRVPGGDSCFDSFQVHHTLVNCPFSSSWDTTLQNLGFYTSDYGHQVNWWTFAGLKLNVYIFL